MADTRMLERGREAFERKGWGEAYQFLTAADRDAPLDPEDLERLAIAAYLMGRDDESDAFIARAHQGCVNRSDDEGAARTAFWRGFGLLGRGAFAPASGWFVRAERILTERQLDSVVRGYLLIPRAIQHIVRGDPASAHATFNQAAAVARQFSDRNLASVACHGCGRAHIHLGNIGEGLALLDEAMASVVAGDVTPLLAGDIYCSVLEACQEIFDLRRAYEWTTSLARWCGGQPELVRYRGECLIYRSELLVWRGEWDAAERDAREASALLTSGQGRPAAGAAFYRLGELHRLRGAFAHAEAEYARANQYGRTPQPGLSLLRLAQGQIELAAASIRSVLTDTTSRAARTRTLTAAVEILLAAGDLAHARHAAQELSDIARAVGTPFLSAASSSAMGAVLLAEGHAAEASTPLRHALDIWRELEIPYEEAQACVRMAAIAESRGDHDGRQCELDIARRLFTRLNADPALAGISDPVQRTSPAPAGGLSEREAQVLRELAAGKTNRAIAEELFISEKTVARHVSNIFDKIGVSSRAAATAWAYQRHLV
jgi:DNA-binding CsgD family transcriptional regulator/tetratricopeptide (TPR) repeat protein